MSKDPLNGRHARLLRISSVLRISEAAEEPYPVRFDAIGVLVVLAETSEEANFCTNGPMDMISVKICATVVDMRQN